MTLPEALDRDRSASWLGWPYAIGSDGEREYLAHWIQRWPHVAPVIWISVRDGGEWRYLEAEPAGVDWCPRTP